MKKLLSLTFILAFFSAAYSQDVSYSFEGQLNQNTLLELEANCTKLTAISATKVKYKEDAQKGEIIIFLIKKEGQRAEEDNQFKATDIKKILINSGLTPGEFRTLKK